MKRIMALFLACVLVLTACGGPAGSTGTPSVVELPPADGGAASDDLGETLRRPDPVRHTPDDIPPCVEYVYNVDVPEQAAYFHDNVFAAVVEEVGEVFDPYWEPEYLAKNEPMSSYDPCYTQYRLRVTQCVKGKLRPGDTITAQRQGYFDEDYQAYLAAADNVMPQVGTEYLCLSNRSEDTGRYELSTPQTMIPMDTETREEIIGRYTEACGNAVRQPAIISTEEDYDYVTLYAHILEELLAPAMKPEEYTWRTPYLDLDNAPGGLSPELRAAIGKTFAIAHGFSMEFRDYETVVSQEYFDEEWDRDFGVILSIEAAAPPAGAENDPWREYFTVFLWTADGETRYENCYVSWTPGGAEDRPLLEYQIGVEMREGT